VDSTWDLLSTIGSADRQTDPTIAGIGLHGLVIANCVWTRRNKEEKWKKRKSGIELPLLENNEKCNNRRITACAVSKQREKE